MTKRLSRRELLITVGSGITAAFSGCAFGYQLPPSPSNPLHVKSGERHQIRSKICDRYDGIIIEETGELKIEPGSGLILENLTNE